MDRSPRRKLVRFAVDLDEARGSIPVPTTAHRYLQAIDQEDPHEATPASAPHAMKRGRRPVWLGEDQRTFDHARIHIVVSFDRTIGATEKGLYLILATVAETSTGVTAELSGEELEELSGLQRAAVRRHLRRLEKAGYIETITTPGYPNRFRLLPIDPSTKSPTYPARFVQGGSRVLLRGGGTKSPTPSLFDLETYRDPQEKAFLAGQKQPSGYDPSVQIQPLTPELVRKNVEAARRLVGEMQRRPPRSPDDPAER